MQVAPLQQNRGGASATVLNDLLYVVGGTTLGGNILAAGEVFDQHLNVWSQMPPMNRQRFNASLCALNNCIYAAGGYDGSFYLSNMERFDPREGRWAEVRLPKLHAFLFFERAFTMPSKSAYSLSLPGRDAFTWPAVPFLARTAMFHWLDG